MLTYRRIPIYARLVAYFLVLYGLVIIAGSLARQLQLYGHRHIVLALATLPVLIGMSYLYLGSLLLRLKYNAWVIAVGLSVLTLGYNAFAIVRPRLEDIAGPTPVLWLRVVLPLMVLGLLLASRSAYRVRSDIRGFRRAVQISLAVLLVTLLYGVIGFTALDRADFHQEISVPAAVHQTVDQFGLTTTDARPYTRRARLFVDSLSVISTSAVVYVLISFFQPLRIRLVHQVQHREQARQLLQHYPSDIDDFFKVWPHDKLYFFDKTGRAALAYHVTRGQALVVGDPFGDQKRFPTLLEAFLELCFVNDWEPVFIHTTARYTKLYERFGFRLQKLGEEAVLDLAAFRTAAANGKYFRQIRNRFTRLDYHVELLEPPFAPELLARLRAISDDWLTKPGRAERRLMMGYYTDSYIRSGTLAVVFDAHRQAQGFLNLVPTFEPHTANYDMLRCSSQAPGNCNDYLLLGTIEALWARGTRKLNLGLTPLAGLDNETGEEVTMVHNTLRFIYANGDRFYSFSGLYRFKAKYQPTWEARYVAYRGGPAGFLRAMTILTRAMKIK